MEKFVAVRPTKELLSVFQQAGPDGISNRTDLFQQALRYVAGKNDSEILVRASKKKIEVTYVGELPSSFKLRIDDEQVYSQVVELFKQAFGLERVQGRLLVTLTMLAWINREKRTVLETAGKIAVRCDPLVFRMEFQTSQAAEKEELYQLAHLYLSEVDVDLCQKLRRQVEGWIRQISDYYNGDRYLPPRRLGRTTLPYLSKVFAGVILCLAEMEGLDLKEVLEELRKACGQSRL